MMENSLAIGLTGISKKFTLHHQKPTLVESFFVRKKEEFWALRNINLKVKKGEKLGIIGPNGAGKSTLLRIITGIICPTTGEVKTQGRIASLIDLRAGFHHDLTGEENIFVNGLLLGMSRKEIKEKFDKIIEFSGIRKFIDSPLHTYSNGMVLRLGFSVAVHCDPDILLVDDVITVGDKNFQKKCAERFKRLYSQGKTIIVVTHNLNFLKKFTQRIVWLDKGRIKAKGAPKEIIKRYQNA